MIVNYLLSVKFFNIESRNDIFLDVCTRPYELPQYKPFEGDTKNSFVFSIHPVCRARFTFLTLKCRLWLYCLFFETFLLWTSSPHWPIRFSSTQRMSSIFLRSFFFFFFFFFDGKKKIFGPLRDTRRKINSGDPWYTTRLINDSAR